MSASPFAQAAAPAHKAAARALGYTLHLGDLDAFHGLSVILRAKLTPAERWWLAWAVLRVCDDEEAEGVAEAVLEPAERPVDGAGSPLPPFLDVVDDAVWWADIACPEERRAYALAAFLTLDAADQADFLAVAQRRAAA